MCSLYAAIIIYFFEGAVHMNRYERLVEKDRGTCPRGLTMYKGRGKETEGKGEVAAGCRLS